MRKNVFGRQFKRDVNERKALFKSLLSELVLHERIETTLEKARAIKSDADKLITKAKYDDKLHARILLQPLVSSTAVMKLIDDLGPRFADRQGGYTRIIKLGRRFNDNAQTAFIEWTESKNLNLKNQSQTIKTDKKELTRKESNQITAKAKKTSAKKTSTKVKKTSKAKKEVK